MILRLFTGVFAAALGLSASFADASTIATRGAASARGFGFSAANLVSPTKWSATDKAATFTLSSGNLTATSDGTANGNLGATTSKAASGKWFVQWTATTVGGNLGVGFKDAGAATTSLLGSVATQIGYASSGTVRVNASTLSTIATYTTGDVVQCAVDFTAKLIWCRVNSGNWNNSGAANPDTAAGGINISTYTGTTPTPAASSNTSVNAVTLNTAPTSNPTTTFSNWN